MVDALEAVRIVVHGRVQNVGFRRHVQIVCEELGLDGKVWNNSDGTVELTVNLSEGESFEVLRQRLLTGPGSPTRLDWQEARPVSATGFHIAPSR